MANPTTNYGWPMPTSTDLVTDLPADFAAFGQPVDTSLKALNPETTLGDIAYRSSTSNTNTRLGIGTNGQVLAVSGGVPAWTTTSDVTPLTTKGDLFTFTTVDARLGVGTNGQVLQADSAEATGLKWATATSGSMTQLATGTLSGSTLSLTSISTSYKSLRLTLENLQTSADGNIALQFNSDASSLYSNQSLSSGTASDQGRGNSYIWFGFRTVKTGNNKNYFELNLPNYASTISYKTAVMYASFIDNFGSTTDRDWFSTGTYRSTTAITTITLDPESTNTFSGGTYTLYGVN